MSDYVLTCSSVADLPREYTEANDIGVLPFRFLLDGKEYLDDQGQSMSYKEFYDRMRDGAMPSTTMVNTEQYKDFFRPYLEKGLDILHIEFSSGLSGTFQSARLAASQLEEEFPDRKIHIVDSRGATVAYGLGVILTKQKMNEGASFDEATEYAEEICRKCMHWFVVEQLDTLRRGGRLSRASAMLGTVLNIKPLLSVDGDGVIIPVEKIRGRKKSLAALVNKFAENIVDPDGQIAIVMHADSPDDAAWVAEEAKRQVPTLGEVRIYNLGPVIGAHTGPGSVGITALGPERQETPES
ncbi:MAG: DegV family protein [Clostridia bacterium]|nr:DegV family protein [Clostridia bacterium]